MQSQWDVDARFADCLRFLEREPADAVFISCDASDLARMSAMGVRCLAATWCAGAAEGFPPVGTPGQLAATLRRIR